MPERFSVRSADGVEISVQKAGSGPPLLLIHGALLNGSISWGMVMPQLAQHFTVHAMDRRGRAPSGDGKEYSLSLEADDIAAVVQAIGGPVTAVAHSYGALATLDALERLNGVTQVILYEPPVIVAPMGVRSDEILAKMDRALAAGDRAEVVTTFLRDQVQSPPERLEGFKSSPIWPVVLEIASTLPRESRSVNTYRSWDERLSKCTLPVTLLMGSESTAMLKEACIYVSKTIPGCRLVVLQGQGHAAMMEAPDLFVAKVLEVAQSIPPALRAVG
ncbi:MAG TPA: alpha/beta hydrolase [Bryobacteraceae bacterium]|nr:alpha/beta hydrolase [Bryobacteraceae bacterium]